MHLSAILDMKPNLLAVINIQVDIKILLDIDIVLDNDILFDEGGDEAQKVYRR